MERDAINIAFNPNHVTDYGPCKSNPVGVFYVGRLFGDDVIEAFFEYGDFPAMEPAPAMWEVKSRIRCSANGAENMPQPDGGGLVNIFVPANAKRLRYRECMRQCQVPAELRGPCGFRQISKMRYRKDGKMRR